MDGNKLKNMEDLMLGKQDVNQKPCRACSSFQSWRKKMSVGQSSASSNSKLSDNIDKTASLDVRSNLDCPIDKDELGRSTWNFLHTMAAYYPEQPSRQEEKQMTQFIRLFSKFYPCDHCAIHLRERLKSDQPDTTSNKALSIWFCKVHNEVNSRLDKPQFDCSKVMERWKDGWDDGSCD